MPETDFFEEVAECTEHCFIAEEDGRYQVLAEDSKGNIKNITEEAQFERRGVDDPDKIRYSVIQTYEKGRKYAEIKSKILCHYIISNYITGLL